MIGIELNKPCKSLFMAAMEKGLIINVTADSVIRLLPPFVMTDDEVDQVVAILVPLIKDLKRTNILWQLGIFSPCVTLAPPS